MDARDGQKRFEPCRHTLPPDHPAAIRLLEPRKRTLGLEPGHRLFNGSASGVRWSSRRAWGLRPHATLPEPPPQGFRILSCVGGKDVETCAGAAAGARPHLDRIAPRHHLGALIPMGRRGAMRQGPAIARRETMDEAPLAWCRHGRRPHPHPSQLTRGGFLKIR